jgi:hypothetical protein
LACNTMLSTTCIYNTPYNSLFSTTLRLPFAWYRYWGNGFYGYQTTVSYYWSSTPYNNNSYNIMFNTSYIIPFDNYPRVLAFPIRCLKN